MSTRVAFILNGLTLTFAGYSAIKRPHEPVMWLVVAMVLGGLCTLVTLVWIERRHRRIQRELDADFRRITGKEPPAGRWEL